MLVPERLVKEWFKPTSRVYKNFRYLFQNPLWNKPMPRGFTVCPYFWLSLFSMCILRPLVLFITGVCLPIMRLLGKPCGRADSKIRSYLPEPLASITGTGVGSIIAAPIAAVISLFLIGAWFKGLHGTGSFQGGYFYIVATVWLASMIGAGIFGGTKVHPKHVMLGFAGLALSSLLVFNFGAVFHCAVTVISAVCSFLGYLALLFWKCLIYAPIFGVPWLITLAIGGGILYVLFDKVFDVDYSNSKPDPNRDYSARWEDLIYSTILLKFSSKRVVTIAARKVINQSDDSPSLTRSFPFLRIIAKNVLWKEAQRLGAMLSKVPYVDVNFIVGSYTDSNDLLRQIAQTVGSAPLYVSEHDMATVVAEQFKGNEDVYSRYLESEKRWEAWDARLEAIGLVAQRAVVNVGKVLSPFGRALKATGRGLCTFASYLWILAKAKKQGACPYFRFEEEK